MSLLPTRERDVSEQKKLAEAWMNSSSICGDFKGLPSKVFVAEENHNDYALAPRGRPWLLPLLSDPQLK